MQEYLGADKQINKITPLVSVCVVTYNHKHFITQCLESILSQKTNFPFELIIGEDDSKDGSREICMKYAEEFPDKIRLFLRKEENKIWIDGNKTGRFNFIENLKAARGKYIALCEGDDYWIDPLKLQKQVDLLQEDESIAGSYTDTYIKIENCQKLKLWRDPLQDTMDLSDVIAKYSPFHTSSFLFYKKYLKQFPDWFIFIPSADMFLFAYIALNGKFVKAKTTPTVYRKHQDGVTNALNHKEHGFHIGRLLLWSNFKKEYIINIPQINDVIIFHSLSLLNENEISMKALLDHINFNRLASSLWAQFVKKFVKKFNNLSI